MKNQSLQVDKGGGEIHSTHTNSMPISSLRNESHFGEMKPINLHANVMNVGRVFSSHNGEEC